MEEMVLMGPPIIVVCLFSDQTVKHHFSRQGINVQQREIVLPLFNIKYMRKNG